MQRIAPSATPKHPAMTSPWTAFRGGLVSLAFWVALLASAGLYGSVALAPKLVSWRTLRDQHWNQQTRLLALEQQSEQLRRVVTALDEDPQFAAEVARLEFDALRPGEEVIAVDGSLSLNPISQSRPKGKGTVTAADPYLPWLQQLATNETLRLSFLGTASCLVILAFTFLQDDFNVGSTWTSTAAPSWWSRMMSRYQSGP